MTDLSPTKAKPYGYDTEYNCVITDTDVTYLDAQGRPFLCEVFDLSHNSIAEQFGLNPETGKFEGPYKKYHSNGKIHIEGTKNADGVFEGPYKAYKQNGQIESDITFKADGTFTRHNLFQPIKLTPLTPLERLQQFHQNMPQSQHPAKPQTPQSTPKPA
jgi:hypothetical protein